MTDRKPRTFQTKGDTVQNGLDAFKARFNFQPEGSLLVGVERECFLTRDDRIAPIAHEVLEWLGIGPEFGFELSACQLEYRVGPCTLEDLRGQLELRESAVQDAERELGFGRLFTEVGPPDMPFDVYPDPSGRYARITETMPHEVLEAACRVIGTHVHIGMPSHEAALYVYNDVARWWEYLISLGDHSHGERMRLYRVMAQRFKPTTYTDWTSFYCAANEFGFEDDPRKCWTLIRISVHGTLEFRMFGATPDLNEIVSWARQCHKYCAESLAAFRTLHRG